jgi:AraC-like DNA-binding protein
MEPSESVKDFYKRINLPETGIFTRHQGHFNVYSREFCQGSTPYSRRDFYKITFMTGGGTLYYADKGIDIQRPALVFSNPMVPSAWEATSTDQRGYFCLFTENFIHSHDKNNALLDSPLYKPGGNPVYFIDAERQKVVKEIFIRMQQEMASEYPNKYDLLYHYVSILIHEALKLQPADTYFKHASASSRIAALFIELLERQFPIDTPDQVLKLKTATDYARQLSVHVNHLNRVVKEVTGKTTSVHIAERITGEAKALLLHTDWNISEIGYSLGFEYPSYFNNFFRKQTQATPRGLRKQALYSKMDK